MHAGRLTDRQRASTSVDTIADILSEEVGGTLARNLLHLAVSENFMFRLSFQLSEGGRHFRSVVQAYTDFGAAVAAEVAAGEKKSWVARVIPSVAYTDPEIAWVGFTETEAKEKGLKIGVGKFPWAASGRAIGLGRTEGFTKLVFDEATHRVIGGGIVGVHAGELISEVALAIEMGAEVADIGHTIHPHPTLGESVGMAAEVSDGTITDLYIPKKK